MLLLPKSPTVENSIACQAFDAYSSVDLLAGYFLEKPSEYGKLLDIVAEENTSPGHDAISTLTRLATIFQNEPLLLLEFNALLIDEYQLKFLPDHSSAVDRVIVSCPDESFIVDLGLESASDEVFISGNRMRPVPFRRRTHIRALASADTFHETNLTVTMKDAPLVMELLQEELDRTLNEAHTSHRKACLKSIRHLNRVHSALPPSMFLRGLACESNRPTTGGGFADIWIGRLKQKRVCVKVLRMFTEHKDRENILKSFSNEVLVWRQLKHPHILPFLGVNMELFHPSFSIVSPWMSNGDIMAFTKKKTLAEDAKLNYAVQIAEGITYLHELDPPVVHGDVKGANVLVSDDFRCCLADFGLSILESQSMNTIHASSMRGSIRWMAPELMNPTPEPAVGSLTTRDIYAFGCTLVELITGQPPFAHHKMDILVAIDVLNGVRPALPADMVSRCIFSPIKSVLDSCWSETITQRPCARDIMNLLKRLYDETCVEPPALCLSAGQGSTPVLSPGIPVSIPLLSAAYDEKNHGRTNHGRTATTALRNVPRPQGPRNGSRQMARSISPSPSSVLPAETSPLVTEKAKPSNSDTLSPPAVHSPRRFPTPLLSLDIPFSTSRPTTPKPQIQISIPMPSNGYSEDEGNYNYYGGPTTQVFSGGSADEPTIRPPSTARPSIITAVPSRGGEQVETIHPVTSKLGHLQVADDDAGADMVPDQVTSSDPWSDDALEEISRLGEGAGGAVHKVKDRRTGRIMARKTVTTGEVTMNQLIRELSIISSTKHVNIICFHGVYVSPSSSEVKILMDFCEGGSLETVGKQIKERNAIVGERIAGRIAEGILQGLAFLHTKKSNHRNIKPSNILFSEKGTVKLSDFGVSNELAGSFGSTPTRTPFYMAPELVYGHEFTMSSDVWSMGISLLELVQNRFPFPDDLPPIESMMYAAIREPPQLEDEGGVVWSSNVKEFIHKALTMDALTRPMPEDMLSHPWIVENMKLEVNMAKWLRQVWNWKKSSRSKDDTSRSTDNYEPHLVPEAGSTASPVLSAQQTLSLGQRSPQHSSQVSTAPSSTPDTFHTFSPPSFSDTGSGNELDLNDPSTLEIYSRILLFKGDYSRHELVFSTMITPAQRRVVHLIAQKLGVYHYTVGEGEKNYSVVRRIDPDGQSQQDTSLFSPDSSSDQAVHLTRRAPDGAIREGYATIASPSRRSSGFGSLFTNTNISSSPAVSTPNRSTGLGSMTAGSVSERNKSSAIRQPKGPRVGGSGWNAGGSKRRPPPESDFLEDPDHWVFVDQRSPNPTAQQSRNLNNPSVAESSQGQSRATSGDLEIWAEKMQAREDREEDPEHFPFVMTVRSRAGSMSSGASTPGGGVFESLTALDQQLQEAWKAYRRRQTQLNK